MVSVNITKLWFNSAADPSDARGIKLATFSPKSAVQGEARTYANGRVRLVSKAGGVPQPSMEATLSHPTADDRAWLLAHVGQLLIVRDPDGGKFAGVFLDVAPLRTPVPVGENVTITLLGVTHSEAV